MAKRETSGPSRYSSTTTRPPSTQQAAACATASSRESVTTTPLPAARPSSLTTYGAPSSSSAAAASSGVVQTQSPGRRHPRGRHDVLGERLRALELRGRAGRPEHRDTAASTASATPATSGASGPTTTRSTAESRPRGPRPRRRPSGRRRAASPTAAIPGLPGATCTSVTAGSRASARARACSRPPVPMTSVFTSGASRGGAPGHRLRVGTRPVAQDRVVGELDAVDDAGSGRRPRASRSSGRPRGPWPRR